MATTEYCPLCGPGTAMKPDINEEGMWLRCERWPECTYATELPVDAQLDALDCERLPF